MTLAEPLVTPPNPAPLRANIAAPKLSAPAGLSAHDHHIALPDGWTCASGERLGDTGVRARLIGPNAAPVVLVMGGISADRFADHTEAGKGWWGDVVAPGGGVDLDAFQVLTVDFAPGDPQCALTFTPADQACLVVRVLDALAITQLHAIVGGSYGAMVGMALAARWPERVGRLATLCAAHRPSAMGAAWRGVQRRILALAEAAGRPEDGVDLARQLAMTTYRSPVEFEARFAPEANIDGPCGYLKARGRDFATVMSSARYATLSAAIDQHDEAPQTIATPLLALSADTDLLAPPETVAEMTDLWGGPARHVALTSVYGHDAFLKETAAVTSALRAFLTAADPASP